MFEILCQAPTGLWSLISTMTSLSSITAYKLKGSARHGETVELDQTCPSETWASGFVAPCCIPSTSVQVVAGSGAFHFDLGLISI